MVRHPLARLISCYRYFRAGGLNAQAGDSVFSGSGAQQLLIRQAPSIEDRAAAAGDSGSHSPFSTDGVLAGSLAQSPADRVFTGRQDIDGAARSCCLISSGCPESGLVAAQQQQRLAAGGIARSQAQRCGPGAAAGLLCRGLPPLRLQPGAHVRAMTAAHPFSTGSAGSTGGDRRADGKLASTAPRLGLPVL